MINYPTSVQSVSFWILLVLPVLDQGQIWGLPGPARSLIPPTIGTVAPHWFHLVSLVAQRYHEPELGGRTRHRSGAPMQSCTTWGNPSVKLLPRVKAVTLHPEPWLQGMTRLLSVSSARWLAKHPNLVSINWGTPKWMVYKGKYH